MIRNSALKTYDSKIDFCSQTNKQKAIKYGSLLIKAALPFEIRIEIKDADARGEQDITAVGIGNRSMMTRRGGLRAPGASLRDAWITSLRDARDASITPRSSIFDRIAIVDRTAVK